MPPKGKNPFFKAKRKPPVTQDGIVKVTKSQIQSLKLNPNDVYSRKNKVGRAQLRAEQKKIKLLLKAERKADRDEQGIKITPKTQEDLREPDPAILPTKKEKEEDVQILQEIEDEEKIDEFFEHFATETSTPKVLITEARHWLQVRHEYQISKVTKRFMKELSMVIPNAFYVRRKDFLLQDVIQYAKNEKYTDVIVIGELKNKPYHMIHSHIPDGPTAFYRVSSQSLELHEYIGKTRKKKMAPIEQDYFPELILNNFTTRLGARIARMLSCLFPNKPEFVGRRVVTFHNQRDFVFFRQHRYEFKENGERCAIQEIGPRFTLRLLKLQIGTFDTQGSFIFSFFFLIFLFGIYLKNEISQVENTNGSTKTNWTHPEENSGCKEIKNPKEK